MAIFCGIDFGTTNTVVSITGSNGLLIDSFSLPTTIFIPFENQGISKVLIGRDARSEYEKGKPGRFIHSIKRSLSDRYLKHTTINRTYIKLEELVTLFLIELKKMIFEKWCIEPENIVLGRPVRFSTIESENALANERLLNGFKNAGFGNILQLEEPVAASLCFEDYLTEADKRFIIVDLGGGTSDFSLVQRDFNGVGIEKYRIESIDGIDIGGDNFDEDIMYSRLSPVLGINATFESFDKRLPMPVHIYKDVCRWNSMHLIDKKKIADDFSDYLYRSDDPLSIHRLRAIIENNLSHGILDKVRESKHNLTDSDYCSIRYNELNLGIDVPVDYRLFSEILSGKIEKIISVMYQSAGGENQFAKIDKVILTGGSSRVRSIAQTIGKVISEKKILIDNNFYDSVSKGLSLYGYYKNIPIN